MAVTESFASPKGKAMKHHEGPEDGYSKKFLSKKSRKVKTHVKHRIMGTFWTPSNHKHIPPAHQHVQLKLHRQDTGTELKKSGWLYVSYSFGGRKKEFFNMTNVSSLLKMS